MLERRRGERVDSLLDDPEVDYTVAAPLAARTRAVRSVVVREQAIGVIVAHDKTGRRPTLF